MKRVLCFGDSLTWGFDPNTRTRFEEDSRWPCVMQEALGSGYKVIEEGQNGRTIATEDPAEGAGDHAETGAGGGHQRMKYQGARRKRAPFCR